LAGPADAPAHAAGRRRLDRTVRGRAGGGDAQERRQPVPLPGHPTGPRLRRPPAGAHPLRRPGPGQPGGLPGDAPVAVRDIAAARSARVDQRWVRISRPMVVVGGELTLEFLDLIYSPTLRSYEAPPHLKANGGVFLVDDFGRERVSPEQLLNRFITPMEHQIDYLT